MDCGRRSQGRIYLSKSAAKMDGILDRRPPLTSMLMLVVVPTVAMYEDIRKVGNRCCVKHGRVSKLRSSKPHVIVQSGNDGENYLAPSHNMTIQKLPGNERRTKRNSFDEF